VDMGGKEERRQKHYQSELAERSARSVRHRGDVLVFKNLTLMTSSHMPSLAHLVQSYVVSHEYN